MNIKEGKYTHKVKLVSYTGKIVTRYTNDPETRGAVLLDCGFKPLMGHDELVFERINPDPITPEASTLDQTMDEPLGSDIGLDVFDTAIDDKDEEVVA